jgi:hypothetical protein
MRSAIEITGRRPCFALLAAVALATVGCGRGETVVRPFVKRGGDGAAEKTPAEKTPAPQKTGEKTN